MYVTPKLSYVSLVPGDKFYNEAIAWLSLQFLPSLATLNFMEGVILVQHGEAALFYAVAFPTLLIVFSRAFSPRMRFALHSNTVLKSMNTLLRYVFLAYFISHIPITILIDLQGNWGQSYPLALQHINKWYCDTYGDFLMAAPPVW